MRPSFVLESKAGALSWYSWLYGSEESNISLATEFWSMLG